MSIIDRKITAFSKKISDRPMRERNQGTNIKLYIETPSYELKDALNGVIDDITNEYASISESKLDKTGNFTGTWGGETKSSIDSKIATATANSQSAVTQVTDLTNTVNQFEDRIETAETNSQTALTKTSVLEGQFNQLIINAGESNAEVVAARTDGNGITYNSLPERLNAADSAFESHLSDNVKHVSSEERTKWNNQSVTVKNFGAIGDGIADDTQALKDAINHIISLGGGTIYIPKTTAFYKITSSMVFNIRDGIKIKIIGEYLPELRLTSNISANIFEFNGVDEANQPIQDSQNINIEIDGVFLNGIGVSEQWELTNYSNLKLAQAVVVKASNLLISNCKIANFYGYGIKVFYYKKAIVQNCDFEKVGGKWYQDDTFDGFGDAIYFGSAQNKHSLAIVKECSVIGYPADRPRLSRCGITFEYGAGRCELRNNYLEGYAREVHVEQCPDINIAIRNMATDRYTVGFYLHTGAQKISIDNWDFGSNITGSYGGCSGAIHTNSITTTPKEVNISKCVFEISSDWSSFIQVPVNLTACTFKSTGGRWTVQFANIKNMENCKIENKALNFYNGTVDKINNSELIGSANNNECILFNGGAILNKATNCRFKDAIINAEFVNGFNFEFDSCRFIRSAGMTLKDGNGVNALGFIKGYFTDIIIRDCIRETATGEDVVFASPDWGGTIRVIGNNYKITGGIWASTTT